MATATSRKMAAKFKKGTRVVGTDGPSIPQVDGNRVRRFGTMEGTVERFVQGNNAQGGYAVVAWDNGNTGRISPGSLATVEEMLTDQIAACERNGKLQQSINLRIRLATLQEAGR